MARENFEFYSTFILFRKLNSYHTPTIIVFIIQIVCSVLYLDNN